MIPLYSLITAAIAAVVYSCSDPISNEEPVQTEKADSTKPTITDSIKPTETDSIKTNGIFTNINGWSSDGNDNGGVAQ